jgi:hypothetical protein
MYMPTWLLERCWCPVHVMSWPSEERLNLVEVQLSGLRTTVVMEHAGCHHYMFYQGEPNGMPILFPVA